MFRATLLRDFRIIPRFLQPDQAANSRALLRKCVVHTDLYKLVQTFEDSAMMVYVAYIACISNCMQLPLAA